MYQQLTRLIIAIAFVLGVASPSLAETLTGIVTKVADGDTVTLKADGKEERIRLIGIDAPEKAQAPWGMRAKDFTTKLAMGKQARVKTDVTPRDKYGRLLGYLYVGETFVNLELVRQGFALVYTYPPNVAHTDEFVSAQRDAREKALNIWDGRDGLKQTPSDFRHGKRDRVRSDVQNFKKAKQADKPKSKAAANMVSMNVKSGKFHEPGCRYYGCGNCQEMPLSEAEAQGGVPCKVCH